jgi:hypothetical protein
VTNINQLDESIIVTRVANETDENVEFLKIKLEQDLIIGQEYDLYIEFLPTQETDYMAYIFLRIQTLILARKGENILLAFISILPIHPVLPIYLT